MFNPVFHQFVPAWIFHTSGSWCRESLGTYELSESQLWLPFRRFLPRVMTQLGRGSLRSHVVSETFSADHRGGSVGYVFTAYCKTAYRVSLGLDTFFTDAGSSPAYGISFGLSFINSGDFAVRWRFLIAIPVLSSASTTWRHPVAT